MTHPIFRGTRIFQDLYVKVAPTERSGIMSPMSIGASVLK